MDSSPLPALGFLVFALGAGLILIALMPRKKQVHSPTRRAAGALNGLVFCLLAGTVIFTNLPGAVQIALLIGAVIAGLLSFYLGRHARKVDRAMR